MESKKKNKKKKKKTRTNINKGGAGGGGIKRVMIEAANPFLMLESHARLCTGMFFFPCLCGMNTKKVPTAGRRDSKFHDDAADMGVEVPMRVAMRDRDFVRLAYGVRCFSLRCSLAFFFLLF